MQGGDVGRPPVRARGPGRLRRRRAAGPGRPARGRRLPHQGAGPASTAPWPGVRGAAPGGTGGRRAGGERPGVPRRAGSSCDRARGVRRAGRRPRRGAGVGARWWPTPSPRWPPSTTRWATGPGFLLESVEGGERWGRYSFVGRAPLATLVARGRQVSGHRAAGRAHRRTAGASWPPSRRCWPPAARPSRPSCRRSTPGWSATSATTWSARSSTCPDVPPDDLGFPDAGLMVIGQLAAFDHWRQRIVLVDNVVVDPGWSPAEARRRPRRRRPPPGRAGRRLPPRPPRGAIPAPGRGAARPSGPAPWPQAYMDAVAAAKEHIVAGDIFQVVLSQRFDLTWGPTPSPSTAPCACLNPAPTSTSCGSTR